MRNTMNSSYAGFEARLKKIDRAHSKMAQGYTGKLDSQGLIVFRPARSRRQIPVRVVALLIVGFFVFKGIVMAHTGFATYDERVATLWSGTAVEQAGAFMMQADPVSVGIAQQLLYYLQ